MIFSMKDCRFLDSDSVGGMLNNSVIEVEFSESSRFTALEVYTVLMRNSSLKGSRAIITTLEPR